jgi:hypothetical protein
LGLAQVHPQIPPAVIDGRKAVAENRLGLLLSAMVITVWTSEQRAAPPKLPQVRCDGLLFVRFVWFLMTEGWNDGNHFTIPVQ